MRTTFVVLRIGVLLLSLAATVSVVAWRVRSREVLDRVTFGVGPTVWEVRTQYSEVCVRFCARQPAVCWGNYQLETYTPPGGWRWETFGYDPEKETTEEAKWTIWFWNFDTFYGDRCFGIDGLEVRKNTVGGWAPTYLVFFPFRLAPWIASVPLQWFAISALWRSIRKRRRKRRGRCICCGYDLRASPARCPECGRMAKASATPAIWPPEVRKDRSPIPGCGTFM
jgi:hypothetical protein